VAPSQQEAASEGYEERFARGGLAMLLESRRTTASLRAVPDLAFDVAPLPRDAERATVLHSDAYCMARASERKDDAFRFIAYALGPEGASVIARTGRTVPSIRSVATSEAFLDPSQEPASAQVFLDNIQIMRRVPNIATWNEIETKADVRVEEWYYGRERPEQLGIEIDFDTRALFAEAPPP
jgi:multiple sugar transport system substrate-binding protein